MKITYSAAASRDGFIGREDGDVSWLDELDIAPEETGLAEFFATVDGLVMGRKTYDFVFEYGSWPYEDKPTWVLTHRELEPLAGANLTVTDDIDAVVPVAARGCKHLWLVGGGRLASSFLANGLLTHLSIAEMPVDLGTGIPLFADHDPTDLIRESGTVVQRNGFRQIDVLIENPRRVAK